MDADRNSFVTGYSSGTNGFETIKCSNGGLTLWTNRYEGPSDQPVAMALDKLSNVFATGVSYADGTFSDYITVAYSNGGAPL